MDIGRAMPSGSGRAQRLDPFSLPVRFQASDGRADEQVRQIELHRERVVVRRTVRGMRMALNLPVSAFRGVALRMVPADERQPGALVLMLEHRDPALSLPLFTADTGSDIVADWQSWGKVLGRPLLVADPDGSLRQPLTTLGALEVNLATARRRRRAAIRQRRPSILLRRRPGRRTDTPTVHREDEIIARN
ncbi:MAG TPA: DUF6101 family protein [Xanthobacteraceae bacterium]|nr:DUF6101 family protein [Xanthobacteraceae bacterium]